MSWLERPAYWMVLVGGELLEGEVYEREKEEDLMRKMYRKLTGRYVGPSDIYFPPTVFY